MGLLKRVVMLPLAPVEGVVWLARMLQQVAEEELNDPERLRGVLEEAEAAHRRGELTDEELSAVEDQILTRLMDLAAGTGAPPPAGSVIDV